MARRWGGGSGAQANKPASTLLPHRRCPSWRRLGVSGIMCLLIFQISGFRVHGWYGVGEAMAAIPSDGSFLLLCPHCCGVVSDISGAERIYLGVHADGCLCC